MIVHNVLSLAANWIVGLVVLVFVGRVVTRRVLRPDVGKKSCAFEVWVGLTVVLGCSYLLHLIAPLRGGIARALLLTVLASAIGCGARAAWSNRTRLTFDLHATAHAAPLALAGSFVFLIIARGVFAGVGNYDSYLYHLPVIEYMSSERVVVGLANLHTRFGWHSSIFNVASLFENGTWASDGFRLANGFIMAIAIIEWTSRSRSLTKRPLSPGSIPILLGVPVLITIGLRNPTHFVSSPSPDLCASLVALVAFGYLIDFLFEPTRMHAAASLLLCGLAMTFRPINVLLLASAAAIAVVFRLRGELPRGTKTTLRWASPALLLVTTFWAHSTIVSGYPIFPSPVQVSLFGWSVPAELIRNDLRSNEAWAKRSDAHPDEVLANWSWFPDWWTRTSGQYTEFFVLFALSLTLLLLASRLGWVRVTKRRAIAVAIAWLPMAVWFTYDPEPRLGLGQFAAASLTPLLLIRLDERTDGATSEPVMKWLIGGAAVFSASVTVGAALSQASLVGPLNSPVVPITVFPLTEFTDLNGRKVLTPSDGDQCGRVTWCTPFPTAELRIRSHLGWTVLDRAAPEDSITSPNATLEDTSSDDHSTHGRGMRGR